MNLLSVDWDFFFPEPSPDDGRNVELFDWGHKENSFFIDALWTFRAGAFLRAGLELPGLSGEQEDFWERFRFAPDAELFWAESHSAAGLHEVEQRVTHVWNYDAHHDAWYAKLSHLLLSLAKGQIH